MADEEKVQAPATTEAAASEQPAAAPQPQAQVQTQAPQQRPRMGGDRGPRPGGDRGPRSGGREGGPRKFFRRKKVCKFCVEKIDSINYKDVRLLAQFVAERGKIVPRRLTGVCTPHQRRLTAAIKQARNIALLPFAARI
ncbi:MAG: 30S ribosomal protein S18 [Acidobacteriia bacterium]|nr:30S ribosomal protein S18 [Terriglobia bacterium]